MEKTVLTSTQNVAFRVIRSKIMSQIPVPSSCQTSKISEDLHPDLVSLGPFVFRLLQQLCPEYAFLEPPPLPIFMKLSGICSSNKLWT